MDLGLRKPRLRHCDYCGPCVCRNRAERQHCPHRKVVCVPLPRGRNICRNCGAMNAAIREQWEQARAVKRAERAKRRDARKAAA
jgi:hypothetical protein